MEKIWHSNMTKEAKWNATKTLKADCMKKSKALNCSGGHHPHPHPPSPGPHPHPPHPSSNCTALWKGCKAAWEKIEHSNMTKEAKMNATKHLKEECMAKAKKMHCQKPHPHHIVMAMMDKPSAECQKIKEGCMAAWKKIMADKSLSKDQKAAKVKALKEACMKKAKAAHCKKMEHHFNKPSAECKKIKEGCMAAWKKIMADKKLSKDQKAAKVKALKEACMKKAKAAHCKKMEKHFNKADTCKAIADWCHKTADKIKHAKLSKETMAKKLKWLKAVCMKKAKAAHCKPCPKKEVASQ
jgi:hypothetical protein